MKSNKEEILVFTDWYLPGYRAGGPITSVYNMIQLLSEDFEWKVFTRNSDWFHPEAYDLPADSWVRKFGSSIYYSSSGHLLKALRLMLKTNGTFYFNGIYSPSFNLLPILFLLLFRRGKKIIISPRGMLNDHALALKTRKKKFVLRVLRKCGIEKRVGFHASSSKEADAIRKVYPKSKIIVVQNVPMRASIEEKSERSVNSFLSVGRISEVKNTLELIKLISNSERATLSLIGTHDDAGYNKRCRDQAGLNVEFLEGMNPSDLGQRYLSSRFFISMTHGENFGHAISEALSHGCPVIIPDTTPWSDVESAGAGWVIPLSDENGWRTTVEKAMRLGDEEYQKMSVNAVSFIARKFNFDEIRMQYINLFRDKI